MNLYLNKIVKTIDQNSFIKNFIKELGETMEKYSKQTEIKGETMEEIKLTQEEDLELYRKRHAFLQEYFSKELADLSKGEIFLVTNKFENDFEYHRYKVAQYVNNHERKYIAFEKDLPQNVQLGDVVRKIDGKYVYDEQATKYVNDMIDGYKQEIISRRL